MSSELYAYTITANVARRKQLLCLDKLRGDEGGSGDLLTTFDKVVQVDQEWPDPPEPGLEDMRQKIFRVERSERATDDSRVRFGRIRISRRAIRHDLEHADTGTTIPVTEQDREGRPMFFFLVVPLTGTSALLLTERKERFGIVSDFWNSVLVNRLRDEYDGVTFKLKYYVPTPVWQEYLEQGHGLEGAVLERVVTETDETKEQDDPSARRVIGKVITKIERKILPDRSLVAATLQNGTVQEAIELVLGKHSGELGDAGLYDSAKLEVRLGNKTRTVRIGKEDYPQLGYPLEGVGYDEEGYPRVEDMVRFARQLSKDIGGPIGLR